MRERAVAEAGSGLGGFVLLVRHLAADMVAVVGRLVVGSIGAAVVLFAGIEVLDAVGGLGGGHREGLRRGYFLD